MPNAILFIPTHTQRWMPQLVAYCQQHGYDIGAVASDWGDVWGMLEAQPDTVVVAPLREHVPPDRLPRLEVVAEQHQDEPVIPSSRQRPRRRSQAVPR